MTEPQPRKYLTRARAKAEANPTEGKQHLQGNIRTAQKRKALAENTAANETEPSTRATRVSRRTVKANPTLGNPVSEATRGVRAPPKRKAAKTTAAKKPTSAAARGPKKVAFVATPQALLDDKENLIPVQKDASIDTDELMSSLGALSVKPKRVPTTRLQLPTVTPSTVLDPLPALSPAKAKRIPVKSAGLVPTDDEMADELSSPNHARLAAKPKRFGRPAARRTDSGTNESKPLDISGCLISSPARRPPASPFRSSKPNNHEAKPTEKSSLSNSILASPARRPPALIPGFRASPIKGNFRLDPLNPFGAMDFSPSKPGTQGTTKRAKVSGSLNGAERGADQDELGMNIDTNLLGRKSPPAFRIRVFDSNSPEKASHFNGDESSLFDEVMSPKKKEPKSLDQMFKEIESARKMTLSMTIPNRSTTPPTISPDKPSGFVTTRPEQNNGITYPSSPLGNATMPEETHDGLPKAGTDFDGDITMEDREDSTETILQNERSQSPTPGATMLKKHRTPSEGGSSYGFFHDDDADNDDMVADNVAPFHHSGDPACCPIVEGLSSIDLTTQELSERRTLFPNAPSASGGELGHDIDWSCSPQPSASAINNFFGIPIDPALLMTQEEFLGIVERVRKTTIPVKLPPEDNSDDDMEIEDQENTRPSQVPSPIPSSSVTRTPSPTTRNSPPASSNTCARRRSNMVNQMGVLVGAVVYVDAHTADGADASAAYEDSLRALGAKVLKSWNWNPDGGNKDKIGITHVVFKDGSPRTLQKVKDSKGVVVCVGVGWVLQCQIEWQWVDESQFTVDLDTVPRGGHRVRFR